MIKRSGITLEKKDGTYHAEIDGQVWRFSREKNRYFSTHQWKTIDPFGKVMERSVTLQDAVDRVLFLVRRST